MTAGTARHSSVSENGIWHMNGRAATRGMTAGAIKSREGSKEA